MGLIHCGSRNVHAVELRVHRFEIENRNEFSIYLDNAFFLEARKQTRNGLYR